MLSIPAISKISFVEDIINVAALNFPLMEVNPDNCQVAVDAIRRLSILETESISCAKRPGN
jgi:hypothetical protein